MYEIGGELADIPWPYLYVFPECLPRGIQTRGGHSARRIEIRKVGKFMVLVIKTAREQLSTRHVSLFCLA
jgi:hypothetical protein